MRLQNILYSEIYLSVGCVLTIGTLNAGNAENTIPYQAELNLNIRSFNTEQRPRVLASVRRIVESESMASNAPNPQKSRRPCCFG
jgi:hippurate hydrolase